MLSSSTGRFEQVCVNAVVAGTTFVWVVVVVVAAAALVCVYAGALVRIAV